MAQIVTVCGIDVSKDRLDVATWPAGARTSLARDEAGLAELAAWLTGQAIAVVALEASGGYEREVIEFLRLAGLVVQLLNPLHVRRFAQAKRRLAKNDRLDAETIAHYAATFPQDRVPRERALLDLAEHLTLRQQTQDAITDCVNQLEHLRVGELRRIVMRRRATLERQLAVLDRAIAGRIAATPAWRALAERLRSVPGVGPVLAATLIAFLPELGTLSRRAIASLVGLAPFDHDSGKQRGRRAIGGGRAMVRKVLYMATRAARGCNAKIRPFAARLAAKPFKVGVVACMHKLLVILNAIARDGTSWQEEPRRVPA